MLPLQPVGVSAMTSSKEQIFREALARIGAGFYTERGAELHAKDIIRFADSNDAGSTAGSESPASPRAAGTGPEICAPEGLLATEQLEYWRTLAHELYAASKEMMPDGWDDDDGHMDHMPGIKLARLAIAKAEGRSNG